MENNAEEFDDRDMTVDITLEDGTVVNCAIETIFSIGDKDYIALLPDLKDSDEESDKSWERKSLSEWCYFPKWELH